MNKWYILGIDATDNSEEIKEAYMSKLSYCNPEDDPEGFIELRLAYEEALQSLKDSEDGEDFVSTPLGQFFVRVEDVYHNFDKRNNLELWKELLSDEVCMRIDNMDETEITLLNYLMGHHLLPPPVWRLLDSHFNWQWREKYLKDIFPPNFINYVLQELTSDSLLYSEMGYKQATTEQIDEWINLYYELKNIDTVTEFTKFVEIKEKMDLLPINHIYYYLELAKVYLDDKKYAQAMEILEPIYNQFPKDKETWYYYALAVMCTDESRTPEAVELLLELNKTYPNYKKAKHGLSEAYYILGEYEKSYELVREVLDNNPLNFHANHRKNQILEKLIKLNEEKHKQEPSNVDTIITLSSHYLSIGQPEKCIEILLTLNPPPTDFMYYHNLTQAYLILKQYKNMVELCKTSITIKPSSVMYYLYATALVNINHEDIDTIQSVLDDGIALDDDIIYKLRLYSIKAMHLFSLSYEDAALEAVNKGLATAPDPHLYSIKADILRYNGNYSEAIKNYEKSQELDPYSESVYLHQIYLYYNMDMPDEVLRVANMALNMGINHILIKYYIVVAKRENEEYEEAKKLLNELFNRDDKNECIGNLHDEAVLLSVTDKDYNKALEHIHESLKVEPTVNRQVTLCNVLRHLERYEEAIEVINNVLEKEPTSIGALMEKAAILRVESSTCNNTNAIKIYEQIVALNENNAEAYYRIVEIYEENNDFENAIHWLERGVEKIDNLYYNLTLVYHYRNHRPNDVTEKLIKEIIDKFPDYAEPNTHYGYFLSSLDRNTEAIEQFKIALKKDDSNYRLYESLAYYLSVEKRFDEALDVLDKGEKLQGDNLGAINMRRGVVLEDMLRYPEALQYMLKALEMEDSLDDEWNVSEIHNRIGGLYMGDFNDATNALHHYQIALELGEDDAETLDNLGHYELNQTKDYTKAMEYFNKIFELNPDKHDICHVYVARGRAYKHLGQKDNAEQDFFKALEIFQTKKEKDYSPCWDIYIALAYVELGQYDKAETILENMIDTPKHPKSWCIKPKCNECLYGLGRIEEAKGNLQKAVVYIEEAIKINNSVRYNQELARLKKLL